VRQCIEPADQQHDADVGREVRVAAGLRQVLRSRFGPRHLHVHRRQRHITR
jgi:hypothetical protein